MNKQTNNLLQSLSLRKVYDWRSTDFKHGLTRGRGGQNHTNILNGQPIDITAELSVEFFLNQC